MIEMFSLEDNASQINNNKSQADISTVHKRGG